MIFWFMQRYLDFKAVLENNLSPCNRVSLVTELHASLVTSRAITISAYPAESCDYAWFAPLRHYRNSLLRFSFFYSAFLLNDQ